MGEEPKHTTARKSGPLQVIRYSASTYRLYTFEYEPAIRGNWLGEGAQGSYTSLPQLNLPAKPSFLYTLGVQKYRVPALLKQGLKLYGQISSCYTLRLCLRTQASCALYAIYKCTNMKETQQRKTVLFQANIWSFHPRDKMKQKGLIFYK